MTWSPTQPKQCSCRKWEWQWEAPGVKLCWPGRVPSSWRWCPHRQVWGELALHRRCGLLCFFHKGNLCYEQSMQQWAGQTSQPDCGHQLPADTWMHENGVVQRPAHCHRAVNSPDCKEDAFCRTHGQGHIQLTNTATVSYPLLWALQVTQQLGDCAGRVAEIH